MPVSLYTLRLYVLRYCWGRHNLMSMWQILFVDPYIPPVCHTITWPLQTLTASHSRASQTERNSWTDSSRQSSLETLACHSGGRVQSRPGWRSLWECPCTFEPARRTSKVARYTWGDAFVLQSLLCLFQREMFRFGCQFSRAGLLSFQVLLVLTDEDLELGLGISNIIHRRKLRLAIEDYRRAEGDQEWARN